jgi:hypothetical protein
VAENVLETTNERQVRTMILVVFFFIGAAPTP